MLDQPISTRNDDLVTFAAEIVCAYVSHNSLSASDVAKLLKDAYAALKQLGQQPAEEVPAPALVPAVSVRKSVTDDFIISLEDGRKFKSLKRYLSTLGMTPEQYRLKWNLPSDYPMVAPSYAARRSELAKSIGLGRKAAAPVVAPEPKATRGRRRATASVE